MKKQLRLSEDQLLEIGFEEKVYPKTPPDEFNPYGSEEKIRYNIKTVNGYFSYNPNEKEQIYVWYHVTQINNVYNWASLNMQSLQELYLVLSCFKCDFELLPS